MNPITCQICKESNFLPETQAFVVATFASFLKAKDAIFAIQKAHIILSWSTIFAKGEKENMFEDTDTVVMQLHGIKDIVRLQLLYIESICQENNVLTFDTCVTKNQCEKLQETLQKVSVL